MNITQAATFSDYEFIDALMKDRYSHSQTYDLSVAHQCYLRCIQAYQKDPDLKTHHPFSLVLEELERVFQQCDQTLIEHYDIQARLILSEHFLHGFSMNFFQYHQNALLNIFKYDHFYPDMEPLITDAGLQLLENITSKPLIHKKVAPMLDVLLQYNVAKTATEQGWIIPKSYWEDGSFNQEEEPFYGHVQRLLSGYTLSHTDEDRALLQIVELAGIPALCAPSSSTEMAHEIALHI